MLGMSGSPDVTEGALVLGEVGLNVGIRLALVALGDKWERWQRVGYGDRSSPSSRFHNHLQLLCLAWVGMSIDLKASLRVTKGISEESDTKGHCHLGGSEEF